MYYNQRLKAIIEDRKRDEIIELPDLIDEAGFKAILRYYMVLNHYKSTQKM